MPRGFAICYAALCLLLLAAAGRFAIRADYALSTQDQLDYGEGIVLWQAAHVTSPAAAYHPIDKPPYIVFHYPPLFHLAARAMAGVTHSLLTAGRLVSILALALTCVILAFLAWSCLPAGSSVRARRLAGFCAGTLIFTLPVWPWADYMRVDSLAMLFTFAGLALFIFSARNPRLAYAAMLFFIAAGFSKQTTIAAPAVCLAFAFYARPRHGARLMMVAGTITAALLLLMQILTHGLFLRHIVYYNRNPFHVRQLIGFWQDHLAGALAVLSMSLALIATVVLRLTRGRGQHGDEFRVALASALFPRTVLIAGAYLLTAMVLSITVGKQGASVNFFYETDLGASLLAGILLGLVADAFSRARINRQPLAMLCLPLILLHCLPAPWLLANDWKYFPQTRGTASDRIVEALRRIPGHIYSDDMTVLERAGKEVMAEPAIITALADAGTWDETPFVRSIRAGFFDAIVLQSSLDNRILFSANVADAIAREYVQRQQIGPYRIYFPKRDRGR